MTSIIDPYISHSITSVMDAPFYILGSICLLGAGYSAVAWGLGVRQQNLYINCTELSIECHKRVYSS